MGLKLVYADISQFRCDTLIIPKYPEQDTMPFFDQAMQAAKDCALSLKECFASSKTAKLLNMN